MPLIPYCSLADQGWHHRAINNAVFLLSFSSTSDYILDSSFLYLVTVVKNKHITLKNMKIWIHLQDYFSWCSIRIDCFDDGLWGSSSLGSRVYDNCDLNHGAGGGVTGGFGLGHHQSGNQFYSHFCFWLFVKTQCLIKIVFFFCLFTKHYRSCQA